jgi:hypothetical protein
LHFNAKALELEIFVGKILDLPRQGPFIVTLTLNSPNHGVSRFSFLVAPVLMRPLPPQTLHGGG